MSVYTRSAPTTDHGSRFGARPTRVVLHHAATSDLEALLALMQPGGRTVSAHAAIGGREIVAVVPEERRSFSLAAALFERSILSAECINSTGAPTWNLSAETHESIARWVADVCTRWGIVPHRDGPPKSWTVLGHREVHTIHGAGYATACPGGMNLDGITARAQQIMIEPNEGATMTAAYLHAPAEGKRPQRFILAGLNVPGGSFVTTSVAEAEALGFVYGNRAEVDNVGAKNGGPVKRITQAQADTAIALYARLRAAKVAEERGTVGAPVDVDAIANATANATAATFADRLRP